MKKHQEILNKMEILKLNKLFYPLKEVENTIEAFGKFGKFDIEKTQKYHVVTITPHDEKKGEGIKKEFANYCLMLSKKEINSTSFRIMA